MIYMILFHKMILRACQLYLKYLKNLQIFLYILYADDIVFVAESAQQLQNLTLKTIVKDEIQILTSKNLNFLY